MHTYRELYCISDLHLGGESPFQIFDQSDLLASFIKYLTNREAEIALVLNGDIVDFLAEPGAVYLNPHYGATALSRIFADKSFIPIWQALSEFVKKPGRELIIVLGNHDVELALPIVQHRFVQELAGNDRAALGRVRFATEGAGFSCRVGNAQILVVHGNEFDSWNMVDHLQLLHVSRALNRGASVPAWNPNAGTKLVIDVMNDVKRRFPFVDLLKPENKVLFAVLYAVDSSLIAKLTSLAPIITRRAIDAVRMEKGFLGETHETTNNAQSLAAILSETFDQNTASGEDLEKAVRDDWESLDDPSVHKYRAEDEELLGIPGLVWDKLRGRDPCENLREALLAWMGKDSTFSIDNEDDGVFGPLDKATGTHVNVILAGHTHLRRAIKRKNGNGVYFNTGTWIRLIGLSMAQLETPEAFKSIYTALTTGTMTSLDETTGLVRRFPTAARILDTPNGTLAQLCDVIANKNEPLVPIKNAQEWQLP